MNAERRKNLAKALELLEEAKSMLETARDDEQEYFDAMPESFQGGDKGDKAQHVISQLDDAFNAAETAVDSIIESLE